MADWNGVGYHNRFHIVLVPGWAARHSWANPLLCGHSPTYSKLEKRKNPGPGGTPLFRRLPTAAVRTRATRLRAYFAKRIARGEILRRIRWTWWATRLEGSTSGSLFVTCTTGDNDRDYDGGYEVRGRNRSASAWIAW